MWVKLDDHFDQHPKFARVGPIGMALWVSGLAYCNRNLTDGHIPWSAARTLVSMTFLHPLQTDRGHQIMEVNLASGMQGLDGSETLEETITLLVRAGLWEETPDGYTVHDYLQYQPSKTEVIAEREAGKIRAKRSYYNRAISSGEEPPKNPRLFADSSPDPGSGSVSRTREDSKSTALSSRKTRTEPDGFAVWYQAYPRHVARGAAVRAYAGALRKGVTPDRLLSALKPFVAGINGTPMDKVPHPATWLNAERWLDDAQPSIVEQPRTRGDAVLKRLEWDEKKGEQARDADPEAAKRILADLTAKLAIT